MLSFARPKQFFQKDLNNVHELDFGFKPKGGDRLLGSLP